MTVLKYTFCWQTDKNSGQEFDILTKRENLINPSIGHGPWIISKCDLQRILENRVNFEFAL